jgi:hypothetical protein
MALKNKTRLVINLHLILFKFEHEISAETSLKINQAVDFIKPFRLKYTDKTYFGQIFNYDLLIV